MIILLTICLGNLFFIFKHMSFDLIGQRWTNQILVESMGFVGYTVYDIAELVRENLKARTVKSLNITPYKEFLNKRHEKRNVAPDRPTAEKPKKNIVFLQLESLDSVILDMNYKGSPVMPFLASLKDNAIYFKNAFDQTGGGRSADGDFLVHTSQTPLKGSTVYTSQDLSNIPSLPKILKAAGYHTFSVHGYSPQFWSVKLNHTRLGFDTFYFPQDLNTDDSFGWGISDFSLVDQAVDKMLASKKPFFTQIITLTNHHPYHHVRESQGLPFKSIVEDHLISARYVDTAVELLFKRLEKEGLLENTIIAIYADHDSGVAKKLFEHAGIKYLNYQTHDKIPMFVYGINGTDKPIRIKRPSGLQDLGPTILSTLNLPIPETFLGTPATSGPRPLLLPGNRQITELNKTGLPVFENSDVDLAILTRLAIRRPDELITRDSKKDRRKR